MTTSKTPSVPVSAAPEEKQPRRKCKYSGCRKLFKPARDWQEFCRKQCRFDFHNLGDAFGTLEKKGTDKLLKITAGKIEKMLPKVLKAYVGRLEKRIAALEVQRGELEQRIGKLETTRP